MPETVQRAWRVPQDFPTIQAAIDAAHEGDVILVAPGLYREHLVITKSLALQGAGPDTVLEGEPSDFELFIEEPKKEQLRATRIIVKLPWSLGGGPITRKIGQPAIVVQAGRAQIRGLQIRPQGLQVDLPPWESPPPVPRPLRAGVVVEKGAEALLEQVIIRNAHYGVVVKRGSSLILRHSILHNWHIGLQIWGTATIEDSSIHNEDIYESESSEKAIVVEQEGRTFIRRSRISIFHVSPYGIPAHRIGDFNDAGVVSDGEIELEENQIIGDLNRGVLIFSGKALLGKNLLVYRGGNSSSTGLTIWSSAEVMMEDNTVLGLMSYGVGVQIHQEARVTLRQNRLSQNGIGIEVSGAVAQLVENEVYANRIGIQLTPWSEEAEYTTDPARVEFVRNRVSQNEQCGIAAQSVRYVEGEKVYEIFKGQLIGEGNELENNLQGDLCPPDYPWPPGFRK